MLEKGDWFVGNNIFVENDSNVFDDKEISVLQSDIA